MNEVFVLAVPEGIKGGAHIFGGKGDAVFSLKSSEKPVHFMIFAVE